MADKVVSQEETYALKRKIDYLKKLKGSGTELISVYLADGYPLPEMTNKLKSEASQATNIKSKSTRKNVCDALEKLLGYLKGFKSTPKNGIAVFCGNVSNNPSKIDIQLLSEIPPVPLNITAYRCDSSFFLEPLERIIEVKGSYGLVVMDGKDTTIAMLKGTSTKVLKKVHSTAHSKIHVGGQSAARFQRLIENSIEEYYKRVGGAMDRYFIGKDIKGVIVGGPGPAKEDFMKMKPFNYQIKILGVVDTGYTDEYGLREVMAKSGEIISEQEAIKEKKLVDRFIEMVAKNGPVTYGLKEVEKSIENYQADSILVSEDLKYRIIRYKSTTSEERAEQLLKTDEETPPTKLDSNGNKMEVVEDAPLIDDLMQRAKDHNIKIHIISTDTSEGVQFLNSFHGVGAFLRYK